MSKLEDYTWVFILSVILSFILSLGLGANDVANSFATSIGSKVLSLRQALIIASIAEFAGCLLLGSRVSESFENSVINSDYYSESPEVLMLGLTSAIISAFICLFIATYFKMPISATHSITCALLGFAVVSSGLESINERKLIEIGVSWIVSPFLSAFTSLMVYYLVKNSVFNRRDPFKSGLKAIPTIYMITIILSTIPVMIQIFEILQVHGKVFSPYLPLTISVASGLVCGIIASIFVSLIFVPRQREKINSRYTVLKETRDDDTLMINGETDETYGAVDVGDTQMVRYSLEGNLEQRKTEALFKTLQIMTATFSSFVHGSNDVANAIGPLVAIYVIWTEGKVVVDTETPLWVLAYGGCGIVIGLFIWGKRVIETIGTKITEITPSSGFSIEIGSSLTILVASLVGIPVSTSHCKVGSVFSVGYASNDGEVSWKVLGFIVISWVLTLLVSFILGMGFFYALQSGL